jgi:hypothetical protein
VDTDSYAGFRGAEARFSRRDALHNPDPEKSAAAGRESVTTLLASAVRMGMESSEINEYLQQQTQFMEAEARRGQSGSLAGMVAATEGLVASGVSKWTAGGITQQFAAGAEQVGRSGATNPAAIRMMRAAGYTGRGGFEEYAEVMLKLQNPSFAAGLMGTYYSDLIESRGLDPMSAGAAFLVQRASAPLGIDMGAYSAAEMAGSATRIDAKTKLAREAVVGNLAFDTNARSTASGAVAVLAPTQVREAEIEQKKIAVGKDVSAAVLDFEESALSLAGVITGTTAPALTQLTDLLRRLTGVAFDLVKGTRL